jgi:hypothetical protein
MMMSNLLGNLRSHRLIWLKGGLFLLLAMVSAALLLIEQPTLRVAVLLAILVWSACRAYYFAFYCIEKYVDSRYRFAGIGSFVRYAVTGRVAPGETMPPIVSGDDMHQD